jgi:predicted RNA-binding Zn ribbon-like protein
MDSDADKLRKVLSDEPGGRMPAPGTLALVQSFINTNDREGDSDKLSTPDQLAAWLEEHGLLEGEVPIGEVEWQRTLAVREGLRALAQANNGAPVSHEQIANINAAVKPLRLGIRFDPQGAVSLAPARDSADAFLVPVLTAMLVAQDNGTWPRLKACRRDVCQWVYYDHSKNNRSIWCTMSICGSREKMKVYRMRRRQESARSRLATSQTLS